MDETSYSTLLWNSTDKDLLNITGIISNSKAVNRTASNSAISKFYPIIVTEMFLSILCLIFSIIVYCILPEFKNVHGKNLISLSSCLLTTFILLCLDLVLRLLISYPFCFIIAVVIHLTFLGTFFWTNVMAFDIWSNMTSMKVKSEVTGKSTRYFKYSIYAWTATILTALPAIIFETTDLVPQPYRPQFGVKRCWLSGKTAFIYYFNFPVGVILFGNLIMFILTIRRLVIIKRMTAILQVKKQQKRLYLYLKLFFVMGIIWVTEFLPWATKIYQLYAVAGMLTALHGVLLAAIFVFKKRILRQIWDRIGKSGTLLKKGSSSQQTLSTSGQQSIFYSQADTKA